MRHSLRHAALAATILGLGACSSAPSNRNATAAAGAKAVSTAQRATIHVASASGSLVSGTLIAVPMGDGVHLTGQIGGLGANSTHAIHIHERGDCSAADASSAGGHFNPSASPHGRAGQGAHHGGDMDNIVADADGVANVDAHAGGVTLGGGAVNDVAGKAVVVHSAPDDYASQPAGNAGARVACGVITVTQ